MRYIVDFLFCFISQICLMSGWSVVRRYSSDGAGAEFLGPPCFHLPHRGFIAPLGIRGAAAARGPWFSLRACVSKAEKQLF